MTAAGTALVARHEFRQRIRAGRWQLLLAGWFVVLLLFTYLLRESADEPARGAVMYGGLMLFVLALALLVVPTLSAQSVNGDRERGTLAVLQVTRLSAAEIALGKLLAAWGTALVFLALTAPLVLWCMAEGGVPTLRVLAVTAVVALLLGTVTAVALALSALLTRSTTSSVLSYLAVFALTVGTLVVFGLVTSVTAQRETVTRTYPVPGGSGATREYRSTETVTRTDRTWWLLAPNPFVVLADAAPGTPTRTHRLPDGTLVAGNDPVDPLGSIGRAVRDLRRSPAKEGSVYYAEADEPSRPVWPTGLALDLLLGAAAAAVAARRLRTPTRSLPRGQRVA